MFSGSMIYASSSDGLLYYLSDTGSTIVKKQTFQNYTNGVRGLGGLVGVQGRGDGRHSRECGAVTAGGCARGHSLG